MLVISRRSGESFVIFYEGKRIEIYISRIEGKTARISIDTDEQIKVYRSEIVGKYIPDINCVADKK